MWLLLPLHWEAYISELPTNFFSSKRISWCKFELFFPYTGDPRISTVNIIWINPGTTTWVENPCSSRNGELAVEVTLEKEAVKQSGDAWRIVLDCCLPVFHLIDSTRSIPYAIKQIQDLFGISCAFDQAVQVFNFCLYFHHLLVVIYLLIKFVILL